MPGLLVFIHFASEQAQPQNPGLLQPQEQTPASDPDAITRLAQSKNCRLNEPARRSKPSVDLLPLPGGVPLQQPQRNVVGGHNSRSAISRGDLQEFRRTINARAKPYASSGLSGLLPARPDLPAPLCPTLFIKPRTIPGLRAANVSYVTPSFAGAPVREFSTTSARSTSFQDAAKYSSSVRSNAMLRFPSRTPAQAIRISLRELSSSGLPCPAPPEPPEHDELRMPAAKAEPCRFWALSNRSRSKAKPYAR